MCYHLVVKVKFHHLWVLLEIFSRPSCFFQTWTVLILPLHLWNKGSTLGKDLPPKPKFKKKTNKNTLNKKKAMHKTRLTQNNKSKHTSNTNKNKKGRERKWQNHLELFSFHTLEEPFLWTSGEGEELKLFKFERNIRALTKSSKRSKRGWKLILVSRCYHTIALLSG